MAGLVPAIHDLSRGAKNVDARDKPGHDEFGRALTAYAIALPALGAKGRAVRPHRALVRAR